MATKTHKDLEPFSNAKPLVPGKGGGLARWRLERDKAQLNNEMIELATVTRRLTQELIETVLFLGDPTRRSPEALARRISGIMGALRRESATLTTMFEIGDLHPALQEIFRDKLSGKLDATSEPQDFLKLLAPPVVIDMEPKKTLPFMLTEQEQEVLTQIMAGETPKAIAAKLGIKPHTIHTTLFKIRKKARDLVGTEGEPKP